MCVYVSMCLVCTWMLVTVEAGGIGSSGTWVIDDCQLPNMGTGKQI